jgi:PAS domain S-box-containing protein
VDPLAPFEAPPPGFLEEVVRHIDFPTFVKDRDHRWVWVNDAFCALVGHPAEMLLGRTDYDFFPAQQAAFFHDKDREVFSRGEPVTVEEEPLTVGGTRTHVLATTKVPLRSGGVITHLVGIIHDITRLKQIEEQLRLANEELERRVEERTRALREAQNALLRKERLAVLGQLSGGLAHQIRTPLSTISNAAAVLRRQLAGVEARDARQALAIIDEEIKEANRIITDLLDFARVRPPSVAPIAVDALLDGVLAAVRPPGSVEIARQVAPGLTILVDERQTRDAICNVIRNAVEAMDEEGRLTLRAEAEPPNACIIVEDTGPGVEEEALVHLFEPLVTTKALGLGLGLTTARALIENQGGGIRYVKPDGSGARFEIRVPLARED